MCAHVCLSAHMFMCTFNENRCVHWCAFIPAEARGQPQVSTLVDPLSRCVLRQGIYFYLELVNVARLLANRLQVSPVSTSPAVGFQAWTTTFALWNVGSWDQTQVLIVPILLTVHAISPSPKLTVPTLHWVSASLQISYTLLTSSLSSFQDYPTPDTVFKTSTPLYSAMKH